MSDLKPCPFCGAEATLHYSTTCDRFGFTSKMRRSCASCGAEGPWAKYNPPPEPNPATNEAWNRRTPDRAALLEVARRAYRAGIELAMQKPRGEGPQYAIKGKNLNAIVDEYLAEQAGKETQ